MDTKSLDYQNISSSQQTFEFLNQIKDHLPNIENLNMNELLGNS